MLGLNIIWVFNPSRDKVLMCKRHKDPYKGLYNLVGGKIEEGENGLAAAYRELQEETGISEGDIKLAHLMDFTYHVGNFWGERCCVEVYVGSLERVLPVKGDEKELVWLPVSENFFDSNRFAGEGNIGHVYEIILKHC